MRNRQSTALRLARYMVRDYRAQLAAVLLCILVSALASVASALFLQMLIDDYIAPLVLEASPVFAGLLRALGMMAALYLAGILATLIYNRMMVTISQGVMKTIRDEMFTHMQSLPVRYFDTHAHGDVMSIYTNDVDTLRQMLSQSLPQMVSSAVTVLMVFVAMLTTSVPLTVLVVICVTAMLLITRKIAGRSSSYFVRQQKALGAVNGYIEEMVGAQKVVKVFCHEAQAKAGFDSMNDALFENADRANKFANILMPIMNNIGNLQYVLIAVVGGALALGGTGMTLGAIAAFLQLSRSFTQPISQISQQLNAVVMALAGAKRIFALLDEEPEEDGGYVTLVNAALRDGRLTQTQERTGLWAWKHPHADGTVTYHKLRGEVEFYDVDFAYEAGKTVLHDITLCAKPGQKLAFVGATGAGKTTITNLINRFYDLEDGKIRYDGIDINRMKKSDLRRSLGVVLQDTNLFTGTVRENIRYGRLDATDREVEEAAALAGADEFICRLPEGYDTVISGNGSSLSQGQRQLLAIARSAVADPPVMILDEATSSIDTRTEAIVQRGMDALMEGRTVFVIAHRLSTVQNADAILVLEHGKVIERGNHDQLINQRGKYYQLYTGAAELE